jgi:putative oxidoreductase
MNNDGFVARWKSVAPYFLSVLRIVAALLFLQHGSMKLFGIPPMPAMPGGGTFHLQLASLPGVAGILELFGGALLLLGLLTRPIAFILSGEMAFAYFIGHAHNGLSPVVNKGELAVLFCFIWLYFAFAGAGPISIDALFRRKDDVV